MEAVIKQIKWMGEMCGIPNRPEETLIDYIHHILPDRERFVPLIEEHVGSCCDKPELTCVFYDPRGKFYRYVCYDCRKSILNDYKRKFDKVVSDVEMWFSSWDQEDSKYL